MRGVFFFFKIQFPIAGGDERQGYFLKSLLSTKWQQHTVKDEAFCGAVWGRRKYGANSYAFDGALISVLSENDMPICPARVPQCMDEKDTPTRNFWDAHVVFKPYRVPPPRACIVRCARCELYVLTTYALCHVIPGHYVTYDVLTHSHVVSAC